MSIFKPKFILSTVNEFVYIAVNNFSFKSPMCNLSVDCEGQSSKVKQNFNSNKNRASGGRFVLSMLTRSLNFGERVHNIAVSSEHYVAPSPLDKNDTASRPGKISYAHFCYFCFIVIILFYPY